MPKSFRSISGKEMVGFLKKIGFLKVSQKGSHIKMKKHIQKEAIIVIVPNHKEIRPGTLRNILKMIGISPEELNN